MVVVKEQFVSFFSPLNQVISLSVIETCEDIKGVLHGNKLVHSYFRSYITIKIHTTVGQSEQTSKQKKNEAEDSR